MLKLTGLVPRLLSVLVLPALLASSLLLCPRLEAQSRGIFITQEEILTLPITGAAWTGMKAEADRSPQSPKLSNQDEAENNNTLARALVAVRLGITTTEGKSYRDKVIATIRLVPGTESGGRTLALGRKLGAYVIAADLIGYREPGWLSFVSSVRDKSLDGSTLRKKYEDKSNNWSQSCGWSLAAVAAYLGDQAGLDRVWLVFQGTCGDRTKFVFDDSAFGELVWQPDQSKPVVVCPPGSQIQGHSMSGALPEELRRALLTFRWPPPCENYCWSANEGLLGTAWLLNRAGYDSFGIMDRAILRVMRFLYSSQNCPATGDDTHQPHVLNWVYAKDLGANLFPVQSPSKHGKLFGYGDWWARVGAATEPPPPPPPDFQSSWEWHFDSTNQKWVVHRINDGETTSGSGLTTQDALRDWLARNPNEP